MLIAIEGLDQSGKETQARHVRTRIEQAGRKVSLLSFPDYGTPIGQEIEKALHGQREFGPDVMQLLYVANRMEYKPRLDLWLANGHVVVCDRYRASSVAYGEAQGLDPVWLEDIQRHLPAPDLTIRGTGKKNLLLRCRTARDQNDRRRSGHCFEVHITQSPPTSGTVQQSMCPCN